MGLGGTLAFFFLAFWEVMGNPMNGTIKQTNDLGTVSFFLGGDFGGLILYLGFFWVCIWRFGQKNK